VADVRTCLEDGGIKPKVADSGIYIPDDDAIPRMDYSVLSIGTFDGSTLPDSVQVFEGSQADAEAAAAEVAARSAVNQAGLEALGLPGAEIPEGQVQGALGATVVFVDESTPATDKATVLECAHG
jgi:hypothetical protein